MGDDLFHITPYENAEQVKVSGLRPDDDGYIYLFTDQDAANTICAGQVFADRYTLFRVSRKGITARLMRDNVAERTAHLQRRVKQRSISPEFLTDVGTFDTEWGPTEFDRKLYQRMGIPDEQIDQMFQLIRGEMAKQLVEDEQ